MFEKERVLKKILPKKSEEEKLKEISEKILDVSESIGIKEGFKPMLCGSVAKGTWLPPGEIDLFLLFPETLTREELEKKGLDSANKIAKKLGMICSKKYSEHPYLRCVFEGIDIDIVPCYDTKPDKLKSAVDRTPWHVRYVISHMSEKQKNEVRLLKKFLKANNLYGADLVHHGFSGYLSELLILKFKTFEKVLENVANWYPPVVLYLEQKPEKKVLENFKNPLVFIDPVDPKRNVAAAVSYETFFRFVKLSKEFLKKPSQKFFFSKKKTIEQNKLKRILERRDSKFYIIEFKKSNEHEDILFSQLKKLSEHIKYQLEHIGFKIIRTEEFITEKNMCLIIESEIWKLPKVMKRIGPDVLSKGHSLEFLKHYKNKQAWIENGKWIIEDERKITTIDEFLSKFFKGSKKSLKERGIPSKIVDLVNTIKIHSGDKSILKLNRKEEYSIIFYKYFSKNLNIENI